jgi:hypothetical protein
MECVSILKRKEDGSSLSEDLISAMDRVIEDFDKGKFRIL